MIASLTETPELLGAYVAMLALSVLCIHVGSGLALSESQSKTGQAEIMTQKDAYMFPVYGSCVLFSLYLLVRFVRQDLLDALMSLYFVALGVLAFTFTTRPIIMAIVPKAITRPESPPFKLAWKWPFAKLLGIDEQAEVTFDRADIIGIILGTAVAIGHWTTKHWVLSNIIGVSFSVQGIALILLPSIKVGSILLSGLFVYDIFWVFGTEVMVTVAKSINQPIKLLIPKNGLFGDQFTMLGLGDIVIPGIFIALMLRYDAHRTKNADGGDRIYYRASMLFYIIGLVTTIVVMHTFQAAQPALLYLVPSCLISSHGLALLRREYSSMIGYSEEPEEPAAVTEKEAESKKKD